MSVCLYVCMSVCLYVCMSVTYLGMYVCLPVILEIYILLFVRQKSFELGQSVDRVLHTVVILSLTAVVILSVIALLVVTQLIVWQRFYAFLKER